jgi:hypothetical protein
LAGPADPGLPLNDTPATTTAPVRPMGAAESAELPGWLRSPIALMLLLGLAAVGATAVLVGRSPKR